MSLRKRATLACTHCHHHKVRCDAYSLGLPCTRCQEDGTTCVLRQRAPRRPSFAMSNVQGFQIIDHTSRTSPPSVDPAAQMPGGNKVREAGCASVKPYSECSFLDIGDTGALDEADLALLSAKGCLHVPTHDLLEDFIKHFFLNIQPYTPLIDEPLFWNIYESKPGDKQPLHIHLLLFQAMLFASSPYISTQTAERCGFKDKRTAWTTLYHRAKLLYHSQLKVDPTTRAQVAVLLSFYTSTDEPQTANLWLAHAIQSATQTFPKPHERVVDAPRTVEMSLYDRLWWSILLRDRILCLGLRRRPQVLSFEMKMISGIPNEAEFEAEINCSRVYAPSTRRTLFIAFRDLCQLAILLTDVVSLICGYQDLSVPYLTRQEVHSRMALASSMQTSLGLWQQSAETFSMDGQNTHSSILRFINLTKMYYQAARINLAHYQTILIKRHEKFLDFDCSFHISRAGKILLDATADIMSIIKFFSSSGKTEEPPLSLLGYIAMPLVLGAIDFKLAPTSTEMQGRRQVVECVGAVLSHLRRVYVVVDFISSELDKILQLAYHTSSKVFRNGSAPSQYMPLTSQSPYGRNEPPAAVSSKNWHDAFIRHTDVYLLISTTVDHFISVGRLPRVVVPPECLPSPLDMMQLTAGAPSALVKANGLHEAREENLFGFLQSPMQHGFSSNLDGDAVEGLEMRPILSHALTTSSDILEHCTGGKVYEKGFAYGKRLDLDYLSFDDTRTSLPLRDGTQASGEAGAQTERNENSADISLDQWDDLMSSMVLECFGLMQQY